MDAIFIIDEEYPSFPVAWQELRKLLELTGDSSQTIVEPLRITLSGNDSHSFDSSLSPESIGRHYSGAPTDDFCQLIASQASSLFAASIPFAVRNEPTGDAHSLELKYDGKEPPKILIPFDETPERARQLFEHYRPALYPKKGLSFLPFGQTKQIWEVRERMEKVGRHDIIQAFEILHPSGDLNALLFLLRNIYEIQRNKPFSFYFQYFAPPSFSGVELPPENLYEVTYQYSRLTFTEADRLVGRFPSVTDTFSVFEQKEARIDQPCSATYTLRRTKGGMYEIRVNALWKAAGLDPETAVSPLEEKTGVAWARIV